MSDDPLPYATPTKGYQQSFGRQVFGVIVRTAGLVLAIVGGYNLLTASVETISSGYVSLLWFFQGTFFAAVGTILLIKGSWVVRMAYARDE